MNVIRELVQTIKEHKEAATGLAQTALDCIPGECQYQLPKKIKAVPTNHQSHARPA